MRSGWLLREGDVVCALEMAEGWQERWRGRKGRAGGEQAGALHVDGVRSVHGVGLRSAVDVAFLDEDLIVLRVVRLAPWRVVVGRRAARSVLECEAGALERWGVQIGDKLDIREVQ